MFVQSHIFSQDIPLTNQVRGQYLKLGTLIYGLSAKCALTNQVRGQYLKLGTLIYGLSAKCAGQKSMGKK